MSDRFRDLDFYLDRLDEDEHPIGKLASPHRGNFLRRRVPVESIITDQFISCRIRDRAEGLAIAAISEELIQNCSLPSVSLRVAPRQSVYVLVDGHRRFEAVHRANSAGCEITHVPVEVLTKPRSTQELQIAFLVANKFRLGLESHEIGVRRLHKNGMSVEEIARATDYDLSLVHFMVFGSLPPTT